MRLARRAARRSLLFLVALVLVASMWELYKLLGPEEGGEIFGWRIIPKTNARAVPRRDAAATNRFGRRSLDTAGTRFGWPWLASSWAPHSERRWPC